MYVCRLDLGKGFASRYSLSSLGTEKSSASVLVVVSHGQHEGDTSLLQTPLPVYVKIQIIELAHACANSLF